MDSKNERYLKNVQTQKFITITWKKSSILWHQSNFWKMEEKENQESCWLSLLPQIRQGNITPI